MRASGDELGWLTWPLDQGEKTGVSKALLLVSPPAPTFPVGICLKDKSALRKCTERLQLNVDPTTL